jgi:hypothetical protein
MTIALPLPLAEPGATCIHQSLLAAVQGPGLNNSTLLADAVDPTVIAEMPKLGFCPSKTPGITSKPSRQPVNRI